MDFDALKKRFVFACALITIPIEGFLNGGRIFPFHVMVSVDHIEPFFRVKLLHTPEYVAVCVSYYLKSSILPQLIPIPDLNIGEAFIEVVAQGMEKEDLVMGKIICPPLSPR